MLVKVKDNGFCGGIKFTKGEKIELPKEVLAALGSDSYEVVEVEEVKEKVAKEDKKIDHPEADKQIKHAANK